MYLLRNTSMMYEIIKTNVELLLNVWYFFYMLICHDWTHFLVDASA